MTDLLFFLTVIALLVFLALREYLIHDQTQKLLDRLMARSLPEYKDNLQQEENHVEPEQSDVVDLDEAREELINGTEE